MFRTLIVAALLALLASVSDAAPTYSKSWSLDPVDSFGTTPDSVTNAFIRYESFSPFVEYWQPTTPNVWSEVVYRFDIPFDVFKASIDINVNAYNGTDGGPNFDSEAQSFAEVSTDGVHFTTVMHAGYPGHTPAWVLPSEYGDISSLVAGSQIVFIRSRMFMSVDYAGFNSAQFLRGAAGSLYTLNAVAVPEPSTYALAICGVASLLTVNRPRKR